MNCDFKFKFAANIDGRIKSVLDKLNSNLQVEQKELDDISNLFLPNVENLYDIVAENSEYTFVSFSIPILDECSDYENYTCYSYMVISPKAVVPLIKWAKFLAFSSEEGYERFVKENQYFFMGDISEKKNLRRFIDDLCKSGKLLLIRKARWIYHVRKDKKTITRLVTEEPQPLGKFEKMPNGKYVFKVINPDLENEIMEMANQNTKLEKDEIMLRREKTNVR